MDWEGIKTLGSGALNVETMIFLQHEGFDFRDAGYHKVIPVIDNYKEWWITVKAGEIKVSERYGKGDFTFEFDVTSKQSFIQAYNQMVDIVQEPTDFDW